MSCKRRSKPTVPESEYCVYGHDVDGEYVEVPVFEVFFRVTTKLRCMSGPLVNCHRTLVEQGDIHYNTSFVIDIEQFTPERGPNPNLFTKRRKYIIR